MCDIAEVLAEASVEGFSLHGLFEHRPGGDPPVGDPGPGWVARWRTPAGAFGHGFGATPGEALRTALARAREVAGWRPLALGASPGAKPAKPAWSLGDLGL